MRKASDLIEKDPSSFEPQGFDWTDWLEDLGSNIGIYSSSWTVTGADSALNLSDDSIVTGSMKTQVYLADGTVGVRYRVTNHIQTNSIPAVLDQRTFFVLVVER